MAGERSDQSDNDPIDPNSYNPLPLGPPSRAQGGLEEELGEMGFPPPQPKVSSSVPLGFARYALPHVSTFASISNLVSRTYLSTFDEAILDNAQNALVMRRDPVIMEPLWSRQVLCAQLGWHVDPEDHRDSQQMRMAQELERTVRQIPRLQDLFMHCLDDIWYGRYGVQFATKWDWSRGYKRLVLTDHMPINGDKLMFRFSGQPAVLVHGAYRGPVIYTDKGRAHPLSPEEREQFIITRHMPEDADYLEGEMAGKRFGVGLRSKIYWWWYQRNNVTQWMFDFLQTIGAGGLTVYYYEEGNAVSYNQAFTAASNQQTNQAILMPRRKGVNGTIEEINKVERLEPSNAGAQLLFDIVTKYYNDQIRSYIKGELLTTKTGPTGLGSNVAEQHAKTATRITKFDATRLQEYLTTDLLWPLQRHTYMDMPPERCPVRWVFDVEQPEPKEFLDAAKVFADLGGLLDAGQVRGVMGFRKPDPGSELLFNPTARQQIMEMNSMSAGGMPPETPPETGAGGGTSEDGGLPDTTQEDGVNEPRLTQPDHPPVQNDLFGGSPTNNGLPAGKGMSSRPGKPPLPLPPNANVDNPARRVRIRHAKEFHEEEHPREKASGEFVEKGGEGSPSGKKPLVHESGRDPKSELHNRGPAIAEMHGRNMRALVAKVAQGEYERGDAEEDAGIYADHAIQANRAAFARQYRNMRTQALENYGPEAVVSEEWARIEKEFRAARDRAAGIIDDMRQEVESLVLNVNQLNPSYLADINQMKDKLTDTYYGAMSGPIGDAIDAFKAKWKPQPPPIRHSKKPQTVDSPYVLNMVKNSPQWKARDEEKGVDWKGYADKFGVHGEFVQGTSTPQHLKQLMDSGDLIRAKKLDLKDIKKKAEGISDEPIHEIAITREPGTDKMLIVDGNHSLMAAIEAKQNTIRVVVDVDDAHRVLTERKRVRYSAEKSSWQKYWGPDGGVGWQHLESGHVRYQKERPTEWEDKLMVNFSRPPYKTQSHELGWDETIGNRQQPQRRSKVHHGESITELLKVKHDEYVEKFGEDTAKLMVSAGLMVAQEMALEDNGHA